MKRAYSLMIAAAVMLLSCTAAAQVCDPANTIDLNAFMWNLRDNQLQLALTNYASYPEGDHYALCFVMEQLEIDDADDVKSFVLTVGAGESKNIYIVGINLIKHDDLISDTPLLTISHSGTGTVYLKDTQLSNVKNGLRLAGTGKIELNTRNDNRVIVAGDASRSGSCIDVESPNAVLSAIQVSGCEDGVRVDADGMRLADLSIVKDNDVGVHVLAGKKSPTVEKSSIYANYDQDSPPNPHILRNDGIRIDDGAMHELVFYKMEENEPVPLLDGEDLIEYNDSPAYVLIDVPDGKSGKVEFIRSLDNEAAATCSGLNSYNQACSSVSGMTNPVTISSGMLDLGPVEVTLPPEYLSKTLVAIYNDPDRGTAGISRQFSLSELGAGGGIVAFVANPYDIPTTGGATDVPSGGDEEEEGGGSSMGGDGVTTEGGGGIIGAAGAAGGCGGGASLMGLAWHDASAGGIAWCILIALSAIGAMRLVHAPIRRRKR